MTLIKAVLFDLDDTLWPIDPVIRRAEQVLHQWLVENAPAVARRFSVEKMRTRRQELMETDPVYQVDLRALRRAGLMEAFVSTGEDIALVDAAMQVFSRARNEVSPFEDVVPVLSSLQGRVLLGSVSNGVADLDTIGMAHYFERSLAAHRIGFAKPHAAIFHAACDALGVLPWETLYVGDDPMLDVHGAQSAGLRAAWLNRSLLGARTLPEQVRPDVVCASLYELDQWLTGKIAKT